MNTEDQKHRIAAIVRRLLKIDAARDAIAEHQNAFRFDTDRGVVASDDDDALLALVERLAEL